MENGGGKLYELCRGIDHRPVKTGRERKSFSVESTFNDDVFEPEQLKKRLEKVYKEFDRRWKKKESFHELVRGHIVKVKFFDFKQTTHECQSNQPPTLDEFMPLFEKTYQKFPGKAVRLIGVGVKLKTAKENDDQVDQISLF